MLFSATSPGNWLGVSKKPGVVSWQPEIPSSWHVLPSRVQVGLMRAEEDGLFLHRQGYFCKASFEGE